MGRDTPTNRLIDEASLYLRQHAHNPVDWYPWGEEALARSRAEDKPMLVSIGYAACHWCHVMERESFEDPEVAEIMNKNFVCIKVDREERPDVDKLCMSAVMALTGQGGWPLNCFMTPDARPFFAGTYFPPVPRYRMPAWRQVLGAIREMYDNQRPQVDEQADAILEAIARRQHRPDSAVLPDLSAMDVAYGQLLERFDTTHGGFGGRPKFPNVTSLELMLRAAARRNNDKGIELVELALDNMANGGIYDHLGGGFARYSTDERWLAPHFEKMLYDNALLPRIYLDAFRRFGKAHHAEVARDVFNYLEREMRGPEGGFYASQDADSEGEEGKFYVWTKTEIVEVLGTDRAEAFCEAYDVGPSGNWEGKTILNRTGIDAPLTDAIHADRAKLLAVRSERIWPARDEKRVCAWNGLTLQSLARGAAILDEPHLGELAAQCADFIRSELWSGGTLKRIYADPEGVGQAKIDGFLDDYAFVACGLLDLYRALGRPEDLALALTLGEAMRDRFLDGENGELTLVHREASELPLRTSAAEDEATPSPAGEACLAWLRLAELCGAETLREAAEAVFRRQSAVMARSPSAFSSLIMALEVYEAGTEVSVVVGAPENPRTQALLTRARQIAGPDDAVLAVNPLAPPVGIDPTWLEGRLSVSEPTAFVCRGTTCRTPVTDPADL